MPEIDVELPLRGSCQCGNITYIATEKPLASLACHCKECQKLSATAFSTALVFRAEALQVSGNIKTWERTSDSGRRNIAHFCPDCGNRIYHFDPDMPAVKRLKSGTLDNAPIPSPQVNQWTANKPDWLHLPDDVPNVLQGMSPEARKALVGFGFTPDD